MLPCTFLYLGMDVHTFLMIDYLCILFSFVFLVMDVRKRIGSLGGWPNHKNICHESFEINCKHLVSNFLTWVHLHIAVW